MPRTILLDLDGTLLDPQVGILGSYRHALAGIGFALDPADDLRWVIGPPLRHTFAWLLGGAHDPEEAVRLYRERYAATGIFEATPYPGILEAVAALKDAGFDLMLCTAKAHVFASRIVERFGFAPYLSAVYGAELDGRFDDKGELIAHILATHGLAPGRVCMVGDRDNDILAARRNGVASIGVLWGYGGQAELADAGAGHMIQAPEELPAACHAALAAAV
ncbi:MAG: HAD hydrolase-like protein [Alphaproteobacteria bacterium]|nr:HAD hydrolase-like protein [Alphaproteobacteria bacterium]